MSSWCDLCLTYVSMHQGQVCPFLFKLWTYVPVHEGHMYLFLFKTQIKPSLILSHPLTLLSFSPPSLLPWSHSLSPSHHLLSFSAISLTMFLSADTLSGRTPSHPRHWSLSLSLYLSLVHPSSQSFITLPERDSPATMVHLRSSIFSLTILIDLYYLFILC
jgi:hypothetical protein